MSGCPADDDLGNERAVGTFQVHRGLRLVPVTGLPEIVAGDDLASLIARALEAIGTPVRDGDVVIVTSKIVSKALGLRSPAEGHAIAVLEESARVVAERRNAGGITRIVQTLAGPVMAAAGVDASNVGANTADGAGPHPGVLLLPRDPDSIAARLLTDLRRALAARHGRAPALGLIVSDTAGRAWRSGVVDFALGAAGLRVAVDHRAQDDDDGRPLRVTVRAVADELAAAADLVKGKTLRVPVVLVRGVGELVLPGGDPDDQRAMNGPSAAGARSLVRTGAGDWFAYGHVEAVRRAMGVEPGTQAALDVGMAPVDPEADTREARIARACAVALYAHGLGDLPPDHPRAHLIAYRAELGTAHAQLIQYGLRVEAPEPFTLGLVVGRLLVALVAEDMPARLVQRDDSPSPSGRARANALLVFS